ncbi:hypothetical protein AKJ09_05702 [Labilithrix luteola]|uniref:Uncharacterized protein n=1 Tax=Labilithrix luteola TaxID=1391654 RepID=A0A0K1PZT5_9BACT|nr:hypothetical protein AKJ09_05702 [Labilithrix luteola]
MHSEERAVASPCTVRGPSGVSLSKGQGAPVHLAVDHP